MGSGASRDAADGNIAASNPAADSPQSASAGAFNGEHASASHSNTSQGPSGAGGGQTGAKSNSSKGGSTKSSTNETKKKKKKKSKVAGEAEPGLKAFYIMCFAYLRKLDPKQKGVVPIEAFFKAFTAPELRLNLSENELSEIRAHFPSIEGNSVNYELNIPIFYDLLLRVYQAKDNDWNDWCRLTFEDGQDFFLNKRTGILQGERPHNFSEERVEMRSFECIVLADGTEVTTYVDDNGNRLYMDWTLQEWLPFREEWKAQTEQGQAGEPSSEHDPRVGYYEHPQRGVLTTYFFENSRNTRIYFDEELGEWVRMPLLWECGIPEVQAMIKTLHQTYPTWGNVKEQLLALRECNYSLEDAITFAALNWNFDDKSAKSKKKKKAAKSGANQPKRGSIASLRSNTSEDSIFDDAQIVDTLDIDAIATIHQLQAELADARRQITRLKSGRSMEESNELRQLEREKTRYQGFASNKDRQLLKLEDENDELREEIKELRATVERLEQQLVAHASDAEKIKLLQSQVSSLSTGDYQNAVRSLQEALDAAKMENTALKLKYQRAKTKQGVSSHARSELESCRMSLQGLKAAKVNMEQELNQQSQVVSKLMVSAAEQLEEMQHKVGRRMAEIVNKYRAEQLQRKLLFNKVQELKGNIRVFCRVRRDDRGENVFDIVDDNELMVEKFQGGKARFEFDRCYGVSSSQDEVFEDTKPVMMSCADGYNVCIMAYGQTGSGKTYTMMGPKDNPGVNRRAVRELLQLCQERTEIEYSITASVLEIYNEKIYDLLANGVNDQLKLRHGPRGVFVSDLTEQEIHKVEDVEALMARGDANRRVAATLMNADSSRSHMILQLRVTGSNSITKVATEGKLTLVDLAGSERVSKSEASGDRLVEAAAINKSLTALGHVFQSLASDSPHVPYRNSKLTHLLQDSLGGDSKTCVFINVSPLRDNLSETHMTLNFGKNVRTIDLGPAKKHKIQIGAPPNVVSEGNNRVKRKGR